MAPDIYRWRIDTIGNCMKKILLLVSVLAALVLLYWVFGNKGASGGMPQQAVSVLTIERKTVDVSEEFPGRTTAYAVSEIRPQVSGIIQKRLFIEGANVTKGQQLYQIDPSSFQASYNSAKANLAKAQALAKSTKAKSVRYTDLIKGGVISRQEYEDVVSAAEQAQADVGVAQAALEEAKINLDYTKVYAPIDGRISKSTVTEGALVQAGQAQALTSITQLHPIYVDITQSAQDMQRLRSVLKGKSDQKVTLIYNNDTQYPETGTLQFADITVDPTTDSVAVRALFQNLEGELLPGMFVRAKLDLTQDETLLVPQKATMRSPDGSLFVWKVVEGDTVQQAVIATERTVGDQWIVTDGVDNGDRIVLEGVSKVMPGVKVKVEAPVAASTNKEGQ
jgi:membrane fusion protein, multidrug efflux system